MRSIRAMASTGLLILAFSVAVAAPAGAETLRFSEGGQPIASGYLEGEEAHGVIHCQPVAEIIGGSPKGSAPGVVVINPTGSRLGAPQNGPCEEIYGIFGG